MVEKSEQYEFENTLSGGLPDGYITALINHVRTFLGKDISRNAFYLDWPRFRRLLRGFVSENG